MEDIINLKSKGGNKNYLKKMKKADGSESKTYILKSEAPCSKVGWVDEKHKFIVPFGGPMIVEGAILAVANAEVEAIIFIQGYGHTITFR